MEHPITPPPPALVRKWAQEVSPYDIPADHIAAAAARWGADQELEACCEYIGGKGKWFANPEPRLAELRAARRPKPPSLKQQALEALIKIENNTGATYFDSTIIRRALGQLDD